MHSRYGARHAPLTGMLADPNIAYLLFTVGLLGVLAEVLHPGAIAPGVLGAIALVLAFLAFTELPMNWIGVVLLLIGIVAIGTDLALFNTAFLALGGLAAYAIGSFLLYTRPRALPGGPPMQLQEVDARLVAMVVIGMAVFVLLVNRALQRARRAPVASGASALIGRTGTVESKLDPRGRVRVDSESWTAVAEHGEGTIEVGEEVLVTELEGVTLRVARLHREQVTRREEA